jgi:carboxymethylenebutenolidase
VAGMVEFSSNGSTGQGYYAPADGGGPGVIVIQEWWGLVPHITRMCDRFAAAGFTALAPDLYHGRSTTEPDEAGKLMMALNVGQAAKDMSGAIDFLLADDAVTSSGVGVVGFCMGGGLALVLACARPDVVDACAPYYGLIPWEDAQPDWSKLGAPIPRALRRERRHVRPARGGGVGLDARRPRQGRRVHRPLRHATTRSSTTIRPEVYDEAEAEAALAETFAFFSSTLS